MSCDRMVIRGKYITVRPVEEDDAAFIVKIRNDETKNQFVHAVDNDIEKERAWIRAQQKAEGDYFFMLERVSDGAPLGTASIYNIDEINGSAEFGRWVSLGNALENLESAVLSHDFAFDIPGINEVYTRTMMANSKVVSFWKRFGGTALENYPMDDLLVYRNTVKQCEYRDIIRPKFDGLLGGKGGKTAS